MKHLAILLLLATACASPRHVVGARARVSGPNSLPDGQLERVSALVDELAPKVADLLDAPLVEDIVVWVDEGEKIAGSYGAAGLPTNGEPRPIVVLIGQGCFANESFLKTVVAHELAHVHMMTRGHWDDLPYIVEDALADFVGLLYGSPLGINERNAAADAHCFDPSVLNLTHADYMSLSSDEQIAASHSGWRITRALGFLQVPQLVAEGRTSREELLAAMEVAELAIERHRARVGDDEAGD